MTIELPSNITRRKTCKRCGMTYWGDDIEIAFRARKKMSRCTSTLFAFCRLCEQDARTERNKRDRWREKVIRARQSHAKKLGVSAEDLEKKHGWIIDVMRHDAIFHYQNGCPECHTPFETMGNGLADITLDIWDRRIEPDYDCNTRWMCATCNRAKGTTMPEEWAIYKRLWRERDTYLAEQEMMIKSIQLELPFA